MFKNSLPGLFAGALGLIAGLVGLFFDAPLFGAIAGLLALAAGIGSVRLSQQLDEQRAVQTLVEAELRAVRSSVGPQAQAAGETESKAGDDNDGAETTADGSSEATEDSEDVASLIDQATGLFSESFFLVALDSRIAAARRHLRPVAMVLLEVVEGLPADNPTNVDAILVADTIKETLREADTACRLRNGYFALLLEDTPENGAIWTVERIRRQLVESQEGLTVWAGVACYPAHAFSPNDILTAAEQALVAAREWRQDRIEVAAAAE